MGARYDSTDKRLSDQKWLIKDLKDAHKCIIDAFKFRGADHPAIIVLQKEIDKQESKYARWLEKEGVI
jgi:hypothetical protein